VALGIVAGAAAERSFPVCGIVGVCSAEGNAAPVAFAGLVGLQHRGHESWGLATETGGRVAAWRELGLARWPAGAGAHAAPVAIGHTRYSTTGDSHLCNAQPLVGTAGGREIAIAHNGNITNAVELASELRASGYAFRSSSDSELILALLLAAGADLPDAVARAIERLCGAYSVVALVDGSLVAFRDPHGIRPLAVASKAGTTVVSSETCALDTLGYQRQREVEPGELVVARPGERPRSYGLRTGGRRHLCVFEYVYVARRDSRLDGERVESVRERLGGRLAYEAPAGAEAVVPVPASGLPAARGFARVGDLPLVDALVRNEYVGRTFIEPDPTLRSLGLQMKFNVADGVAGRSLAVVDDSLVRGSTMRRIVRKLRAAGAREVHVRIAAPPFRSPCFYGVDIADPGELVAAATSPADLGREIGATSLAFLSLDGLESVLGAGRGLCDACFTGRYPTPIERIADKGRLEAAPPAEARRELARFRRRALPPQVARS
jgi:amidophosphoribosyltransferase